MPEPIVNSVSRGEREHLAPGLLEDIQLWMIGKYGDKASEVDPDQFLPFLAT